MRGYKVIKLVLGLVCCFLNCMAMAQTVADSLKVPASKKYSAGFLHKLIMGSNYRKIWAEPVTIPIFNLKKQGFEIKELGGGQQTKSLRLTDKEGREWALRSVDKEVKPVALPEGVRFPLAINFVQDLISASHPYGALTVGFLAKAVHIVAPEPSLYWIGDDANFGQYRQMFANTMCFLEEREPTPDNSSTEKTEEVLEEIVDENDHLIRQEMVLRARLLDMLVADWDRHSDQWRWGVIKENGDKFYYAIPRDRDQAFFQTNGLLPRFIKLFGMKHINNFKNNATHLKNLNFKTWGFDKTFLNELDAADWERIINNFTTSLPDTTIRNSVKKMPAEVYAIGGAALEKKLISRRNTLLKNALKYYRFISGTVYVTGTAQRESFVVREDQKKLTVQVFRYKGGKRGEKIYERSFDPKTTGEIYLDGMGDDDQFVVEKGSSSKIRLKITGGKGNDEYDIQGRVKATLYDTQSGNTILNQGRAKLVTR